jgi:hypothetical protein
LSTYVLPTDGINFSPTFASLANAVMKIHTDVIVLVIGVAVSKVVRLVLPAKGLIGVGALGNIQIENSVGYHSGGSMKLNACILFLARMVYL